MHVHEGGVNLEVPEQESEGAGDGVFFNPEQELNRDLTVAVLRAYREREPRADTYCDAMAASGARGVRAAADGWDVTLCDTDPDAVALCEANLARNDCEGTAVERDANALLQESYFDVVDVDPFGTPMPFADAAFAAGRDLVCVTATDTAPLCGAHFTSGVRKYSAIPRNTDYHPEMGLRILVSALVRTAARIDVAARPIASHATRHYVRTYLELTHRASDANDRIDALGYLHHCEDCLARQAESGLIAHPPATCPNCGSDRTLSAGPVYLASLNEPEFVRAVRDEVGDDMGTAERARDLCATLVGELDEPTHYDHHRLCKAWSRPAESMDEFFESLRAAGHAVSPAHYGGTTFKTDADVAAMRAAVDG
jgi:tRNA (guanine26-N2/guanine27-N2)-dimethyltransferase